MRKIKVFILPSFILYSVLFLCLCKPEFLTCIIFFLSNFFSHFLQSRSTNNKLPQSLLACQSLFILHFWKIILQVQNPRLGGFAANTLNIHYLVFLLAWFLRSRPYFYLCSSTGKVFSSSGFFPSFFLISDFL